MAADWDKIREEYIAGGISYRKLADKHGVSETTLTRKAIAQKWAEQREQAESMGQQAAVIAVAEKRRDFDIDVMDVARFLLDTLWHSAEKTRETRLITARMMKDYSDALRSLQQVMDSRPTELDMEEQKARIEKLKKESVDTGSKAVTVRIEGCDDYAG